MGNTVQSNGRRVFNDVISHPQDSQDLADDIFAASNVRLGTSAERQALPSSKQRAGMLWVETDTSRIMRTDGAGDWTDILGGTAVGLTSFSTGWSATPGYSPYLVVRGRQRFLFGAATRAGGGSLTSILTIPVEHRPPGRVFLGAGCTSGGAAYQLNIDAVGVLNVPYGGGSTTGAYPLTGVWEVP